MTTIPRRVLVVSVSDDRDTVTSAMSHWAIDPIYCTSVSEPRELLPNVRPCVISCEETLADGTYRELLRELIKSAKPPLVVISLAADCDDTYNETYNEAITLGAFEVIASPCRRSDVQWIAIRAMQDQVRRCAGRRHSKLLAESLGSNPELSKTTASKGASQGGV
jgi:DNA-binding NtrC family response regulator